MLKNKKGNQLVPFHALKSNYFFGAYLKSFPMNFANIKDVSDIKLSEEKFSKTFRNSPILSCLINYETKKIIDVNDVFMEKLGYSLEDIKSINARDVFGHLYSLLESKSVRSDTIKNLSTKIRLKNGSDIDSNVSVSYINIQDKECCLIMAEDTSELLRLLENLKIANALLGSEDFKKDTKLKINSIVREIDHCITQLTLTKD